MPKCTQDHIESHIHAPIPVVSHIDTEMGDNTRGETGRVPETLKNTKNFTKSPVFRG